MSFVTTKPYKYGVRKIIRQNKKTGGNKKNVRSDKLLWNMNRFTFFKCYQVDNNETGFEQAES